MSMTVEQRVQKASLAVITHPKYRSMGGVVMMGATEVKDDIPTACTDGLNVMYGRTFVETLDDPQLRFVVLHETMHKALRHLTTWRWMWEEDPGLANAACDHVSNLLLIDADADEGFIRMPPSGLADRQYAGMDSGEVYRLMKKNGGSGGNAKGGFDAHDWKHAVKRPAQEVKEIEEEVAKALQQGGMLAGKLAGGLNRAIQETLAPKIYWPDELRDFVTTHCSGKDISTWRRPNRRLLGSDIYMPSTISESVGRLGVGVDTSASIGGEILTRFLSEVSAIGTAVNPELIDLLYWDTEVAGHEKYAAGQYEMLTKTTKPKGGGGTAPSCVTQYLAANRIRPECFIMLSDGHVGSDWGGAWPCPVLWCITTKHVTAGTGKTLYIGD